MDTENLWPDWKFKEQLHIGHVWEVYVGIRLHRMGLKVELPEKSVRANRSEIGNYANEVDLWVSGPGIESEDERGVPVEVKSRGRRFTCPEDHPDDDEHDRGLILLPSVRSWDNKNPKPFSVLKVSQKTGAIIGIRSADADKWLVIKRYDPYREYTDTTYAAPKGLWYPVAGPDQHVNETVKEIKGLLSQGKQ